MTERERLTQAVVEAARKIAGMAQNYRNAGARAVWTDEVETLLLPALFALDSLDAPPPEEAGEVVEVAVWQSTEGLIWWCTPHSRWDADEGGRDAIRLGTTRLAIKGDK